MVETQAKYQATSVEKQIFGAAEAVFHERGFDGARMQEIADRAGINKAMLHYYFRSKELLFQSVFEEALGKVRGSLVEILGSDMPLGLKIRRFAETYVDHLHRNPRLPGFIIHELNRHPDRLREMARDKIAPVLPKMKTQVEEAVADGKIRAIRAEDLVCNLVSLCIFPFLARPVLQTVLDVDDQAYEDLLEDRKTTVVEFVFNALRP